MSIPLFHHQTSDQWRQYFLHNAATLRAIPWHDGVHLTPEEELAITKSIREFQLGESSEGKHLIRQGKEYADQTSDSIYPVALGLFIAEEHRHARDLGRVLDLAGIPRASRAWPDVVFRWLRHRAGLELSIAVLVTAEIIAQVYYPALREASTSTVLRTLCDQIIADEVAHVHFQAARLALLRQSRSRVALLIRSLFSKTLFTGAAVVVWIQHHKVFRAGGWSLRRYWQDTKIAYADAARRSNPHHYHAISTAPVAPIPEVGHPVPVS